MHQETTEGRESLIRRIAAMACAAALALSLAALAGCSSSNADEEVDTSTDTTTLEGYMANNEDFAAEMEESLASAAEEGVTIAYEGNVFVMSYVLSDIEADDENMDLYAETFESMFEETDFESSAIDMAVALEERSGIEGITIQVNYYASDGSTLVWSASYDADGRVE